MKTLASIAAAAAALGAGAAFAYSKTTDEQRKRFGYDTADTSIRTLLSGISCIFPADSMPLKQEYIPENFYNGNSQLLDKPKSKAKWSLGYCSASVVPEDVTSGKYFVAGYLAFPPNPVEDVLDDQCVRAIALDDGSGRGICIFAVIDCVGISNTDIRRIRARLAPFAAENNIVAINISATHCHSAIDTQGLWGKVFPDAIKANYRKLKKGETDGFLSGREPSFMENLYIIAADTIKTAVADMKKGTLYNAVSNEKKYSRDKRPPYIVEDDLTTLRFAPDDGSRETVAVFMAAHPVALGEKNRSLSSDYPYYLVDELKQNGYNGMFFQGPQLAVATKGDEVVDEELAKDESLRGFMIYGRSVARYAMSLIGSDKEKKVAPLLNIRLKEIFVPADNEVLMLAGLAKLVNNKALRTESGKREAVFVSEVGYVQVGDNLRFALIPGEFATELYKGGGYNKDEAYRKTDWTLPPLTSLVKDGSKLVVIGLCNDSIGYILPANDYGSIIAPLHYEEAVSAGPRAGETVVEAVCELVNEVGK